MPVAQEPLNLPKAMELARLFVEDCLNGQQVEGAAKLLLHGITADSEDLPTVLNFIDEEFGRRGYTRDSTSPRGFRKLRREERQEQLKLRIV
jgi:hypothetical protein